MMGWDSTLSNLLLHTISRGQELVKLIDEFSVYSLLLFRVPLQ